MEQYDVMCPICGTLNKGLFLDETGGWMECEHCHTMVMDGEYARKHTVRIPLIKMDSSRSTWPRRPYKCPRVPQEARRKSDGRIRHAFVCLLSKV